MAAKACVACGKSIAESFAICAFCKAAQPATVPPASKETRCAVCKRPYASRLETCPHCVRAKSSPSSPSLTGLTAGSSGGFAPALGPTPPPEENRIVGSAIVFGGPFLLGAIWGIAQMVHSRRLGGEESRGLTAVCVTLGLFVAIALAILFVRRAFGSLSDAMEENGIPKFIGFLAGAIVIALGPAALTIYALVNGWNGLAIGGREREVTCKAATPVHATKEDSDLGWSVAYTCEIDGELLVGSLSGLIVRPDLGADGELRFRAAKGRSGLWIRRSDPLPAPLPGRVLD